MPSGEMPPPGRTQCRWGWWRRACPHVWSTAKESDLRPQMLGIGRNGAQCLAGRPEQNVVDDVLILKGNGCDWLRHREDHMEILGVEKLGSTIIQPLGASQRLAFWTVAISARIITDALVVTAVTLLDVSTKRRGSTQLNGAHDATLCSA